MAEYIDRGALIAKFKMLTLGENILIERVFTDGVYAVIETFHSSDVVPVVRCRDCRYCLTYVDEFTHEEYGRYCSITACDIDDLEDFCRYGKRRETK